MADSTFITSWCKNYKYKEIMVDPQSKPKLSDAEQNTMAQWLLQHSHNGKLVWGAKKEAAELFHVDLKTIWRIWKIAAAQQIQGIPVHVKSMKKGSTHKDKWHIDVDKVKNLSVLRRSSLRVMACNLGISKSLIHVWVKEKKLKPHTNAIKPFLTPQNKLCRLNWSLSQLGTIIEGGKIKFQTMYNTIHIDEKWFNLSKSNDSNYLLPEEIEPYRTCKSKRYIPKIMFMCAVSRPIIDVDGIVIFDGKFGIFPFITYEPAQRNSKNRSKGTMEIHPILAITKPVIKNCLINEVSFISSQVQHLVHIEHASDYLENVTSYASFRDSLRDIKCSINICISMKCSINISLSSNMQMVPVFKAKWPAGLSKHIYIQQDNAKPHIQANDPDFLAVARSDGFNIHLVCQPANSPDTNVNDLGFFRAIQSLKDQKPASGVAELLHNVKEAYTDYPPSKLNNVFLTLQGCYTEIMKVKGDNNYRIPHMGKKRLARLGQLPECLEVSEELVRDSMEFLNIHGTPEDRFYNLDELIDGLGQIDIEE